MHLKKLSLACLVASLATTGCGGGGGSPAGSTVPSRNMDGNAVGVACVDHNHNWRCDDGDTSITVHGSGDTGLSPASDEHVLLETHDTSQKRTLLLLSAQGSPVVNGISTLKTLAGGEWNDALASLVAEQNSALETVFAQAMQQRLLALTALHDAGDAVRTQMSVTPTLSDSAYALGDTETVSTWDTAAGTENRQLTAFGSTVLSNTETNRLYLFDASATVIGASEIDLLPVLDTVVAAASNTAAQLNATLIEPAMKMLAGLLDIVIDTASAASSITGEPSGEPPVVFEPGTGISSLQLAANGRDAYVLMNTAENPYPGDDCLTTGSEGLYKVALDAASGYRLLANSPACIHSGFSLLATDLTGAHVIAWDAPGERLWVMNGDLARTNTIATGVSNAQALAISPGGQFAAIAAYGQLAIVDLVQGRTVANLAGDWTNAEQVDFSTGLHRVVVTSGSDIHTVTLDNRMQLVATHKNTLNDDILALASAPDGESYLVSTATQVHWYAATSGDLLATQSVPEKVDIKRVALTDQQAIVLGQQRTDDRYALFRLPLGLPTWPQ